MSKYYSLFLFYFCKIFVMYTYIIILLLFDLCFYKYFINFSNYIFHYLYLNLLLLLLYKFMHIIIKELSLK